MEFGSGQAFHDMKLVVMEEHILAESIDGLEADAVVSLGDEIIPVSGEVLLGEVELHAVDLAHPRRPRRTVFMASKDASTT